MISLARRKHRLTQEQFAHLLGVSFSSINAWETGKRVPQKRMQELILAVTQKDKLPNFQERLVDKMRRYKLSKELNLSLLLGVLHEYQSIINPNKSYNIISLLFLLMLMLNYDTF